MVLLHSGIFLQNFNLSIQASYPKINLPEAKIYSSRTSGRVLTYSLNIGDDAHYQEATQKVAHLLKFNLWRSGEGGVETIS